MSERLGILKSGYIVARCGWCATQPRSRKRPQMKHGSNTEGEREVIWPSCQLPRIKELANDFGGELTAISS